MGFRYQSVWIATAALVALVYHAAASATNFTSVVYDEKADKLIITIAYRGTHEDHNFSIQWGECRPLDDERFQTYGLLIDSDPMDTARQEFSKTLEIDMASYPCRPARLTVRTASGFNRSLDIPKPKKNR
jgi:hypothetical protein